MFMFFERKTYLETHFLYNFSESMEDLKKQRGEELSFPVLAFHGTEQKNIKPIVENNFKVPGNIPIISLTQFL